MHVAAAGMEKLGCHLSLFGFQCSIVFDCHLHTAHLTIMIMILRPPAYVIVQRYDHCIHSSATGLKTVGDFDDMDFGTMTTDCCVTFPMQ